MRGHMEGALYEHGVDIILAGHVHAYERTHPVCFGEKNETGIVYFTIGLSGQWRATARKASRRWAAPRRASRNQLEAVDCPSARVEGSAL